MNESLSDSALEDFYKQPLADVSSEEGEKLYELRLMQQLGHDLQSKLSELGRNDPCDLPGDVVARVSCALLALVREVEWAEGVASTAFSSRMNYERRLRKKNEEGR